jgi:predicted type IV restriction endonuclease
MNQEDRQGLKRLAEMTAYDIGGNENSVKVNFIIPFLQSFGYKNPEFEHSAQGMRIDIMIKSSGHKILIEAKGSDKNLDDYIVSQLKRYCDEKRPILAIITNGEEIRFYSPFWKKTDFNETLIYSITRQQLSDNDTIERIERVLIKDGNIVDQVEDREKEISNIKKEIQSLEFEFQNKIAGLDSEIKIFEKQYETIRSQIDQKKNELSDLKRDKDEKITDLKKHNLFYISERMYGLLVPPTGISEITGITGKTGIIICPPDQPPDLSFTKFINATFGTQSPTKWSALVRCAVRTALQKNISIGKLKSLSIPVIEGQKIDEGYHPLPDMNVALRGVAAGDAWSLSLLLAKELNVEITVRFRWPEKDGAAYPGKEGLLQWKP